LLRGLFCPASLFRSVFFLSVCLFGQVAVCFAQDETAPYTRKNSFGVVTAYSPDSSHIFLGYAENRVLLDIGLSYSRRLLLNHTMNWQFDAELLPVAFDSDPVQVTATTITFPNQTYTFTQSVPTEAACHPSSFSGTTLSYVATCTRRWVPGLAFSPIGMQWNLRPAHRLQPIIEGHGGYMYSSQPIPVNLSGNFNFTFDVGVGFEFYRTHSHSYRVEYRYHHISNHETAQANPGIDSGVIQISWLFGR
jgi:hypothetical protein